MPPFIRIALLMIPAMAACERGNTLEQTAGVPPENLARLVTLPLGAEAPGLFLKDGNLFLNVQHPDDANEVPDEDAAGRITTFDRATVGVISGIGGLPEDFAGVSVPETEAEKEVPRTALGAYQVLLQQGEELDQVRSDLAGSDNTRVHAGDIVTADGSAVIKNSNDPDFNGVIDDGSGGYYLYTSWEDRPGGMSRVQMSRPNDGINWDVEPEGMLDFSSMGGTWVNCFGTVSPWDTPLAAEELYFDNTADWFDKDYQYFSNPQAVAEYLGHPTDGSGQWPNPYRQGYIVELTNPKEDKVEDVTPNKRYALGRFSHENAVVMPDERTVYMSEDGTGTVFYKFVADTAGDLSAGTLYAAKATQDAGSNDPATTGFDIQWVELGSGKQSDINGWIAEYDNQDFSGRDLTPTNADYITDAQVDEWANDGDRNGATVAAGADGQTGFSDDRPAFLESRKAGDAKGAPAEFRKAEGVNINLARAEEAVEGTDTVPGKTVDAAYVYLAMAEVNETLADLRGDIRLQANECGVVYRMRLEEDYNVSRMEPVLAGGPHEPDAQDDSCSAANVANPDNIVVLRDGRVVIGEDSSHHRNNMVWVFDPAR